MKRRCKIYNVYKLFSAFVFILALSWLTVGAPFIYAAQQELAKKHKMEKVTSPLAASDEEYSKPSNNNTEEKTTGNTSLSEEFLHNDRKADYYFFILLQYQKFDNAGTYIAYHGELLVPPPNVL